MCTEGSSFAPNSSKTFERLMPRVLATSTGRSRRLESGNAFPIAGGTRTARVPANSLPGRTYEEDERGAPVTDGRLAGDLHGELAGDLSATGKALVTCKPPAVGRLFGYPAGAAPPEPVPFPTIELLLGRCRLPEGACPVPGLITGDSCPQARNLGDGKGFHPPARRSRRRR
jgi:hypothetical protein